MSAVETVHFTCDECGTAVLWPRENLILQDGGSQRTARAPRGWFVVDAFALDEWAGKRSYLNGDDGRAAHVCSAACAAALLSAFALKLSSQVVIVEKPETPRTEVRS